MECVGQLHLDEVSSNLIFSLILDDCKSNTKHHQTNLCAFSNPFSIPILFVVGFVLRYVWGNLLPLPENEELIASYQLCVCQIVTSIFVELLVEPFYIYGHLNGFIKSRVLIEGFTNMFRTFGMVLIVFCESEPKEILALFGILHLLASIGYSLIYFLVFYFHFQTINSNNRTDANCLSDFLPSFSDLHDTGKLLAIVGTFFVQTIFKQILTEGESIVMTFFNLLSFADQGIYHTINNLSSLAARFVFAPVEESSYLVFAQFINRNQPFERQPERNLQVVCRVLKQLLRLMILIGLVIMAFGFNYSQLVILLYGGREFASTEAVEVMKCQCFYVAIIAINGVTETFTFASMSRKELVLFNYLMVSLSMVFLVSSFLLVPIIGLPGFVLATSIQMVGRIAFSFYLVRKNFARTSLKVTPNDVLPRRLVIGYLLFASISLYTLNVSSWRSVDWQLGNQLVISRLVATSLIDFRLKTIADQQIINLPFLSPPAIRTSFCSRLLVIVFSTFHLASLYCRFSPV